MTVLRSGAATDVGRVRAVNQDLALESPDLYAVADGMGGHAGGEVAARLAVDALQCRLCPTSRRWRGCGTPSRRPTTCVWSQSTSTPTCGAWAPPSPPPPWCPRPTAGDVVALANVGDSRAYVYSGGRIAQITEDHSLAEEKVRQGELTEAEAAVHPHRHILTRALGVADASTSTCGSSSCGPATGSSCAATD